MTTYETLLPYIFKIIEAARYTIYIAFFAAIFGFVIGLILALMKQTKSVILKKIAYIYTDLFRGTPVILQIAIMWYIVFSLFPFYITPLIAAITTFSLNSGAYVSEIMRAGIQNVDKGQIEAAKSMGVKQKDIILDIIIPQAVRKTIPPLINEFATLIKESSIAYTIGVMDVMYQVNRAIANVYTYLPPLLAAGVTYYVLVKIVTVFGKSVERKLSYDQNQ